MTRPSNDPRSVLADARVFVATNLAQGCRELLEWHRAGLLPDGVVRQVEQMLIPIGSDQAMSLAERLFETAAMEFVAGMEKTP